MNQRQVSIRIYQIRTRLELDDRVVKAGNPPTLHPGDRHELIDELDQLYLEQRKVRAVINEGESK